jgi:hypothetical protein
VNREDPVGLLGIGAPEDEYEPEIRDLIKWRSAMPIDMTTRIPDGINQARAEHMPT